MQRLTLAVLLLFIAHLTAWAAPDGRTLRVTQTASAKRIALVIGNDRYQHVNALHNAVADARAMATALERAGFQVTLKTDTDLDNLKQAIRQFKARLSGGDEALFFYAGHAVQINAANYLLPVNIRKDNEEQVKDDAIPLQRLLDDLREQKVKFALAIIDACRDNPFQVSGRSIGGTRGLAATNAASGQMIFFSAGAGQQALDRLNEQDRDQNGVFTRIFLQEMQKPSVSAYQVLRNVRSRVVAMTNQQQVPALYDETVNGDFYFYPTASPTPQDGLSVEDLRAQQALRNQWNQWQTAMQADYDQIIALNAEPDLSLTAWTRFLSTHTQDNPFSSTDEQLRSQAQSRQQAAQQAAVQLAEQRRTRVVTPVRVATRPAYEPTMVSLPAGSFTMGCSRTLLIVGSRDSDCDEDEKPAHTVNLNRFELGKTEVTQGQWKAVMGSNPSHFSSCGDNCPVEQVSWDDVQTFIQKLNAQTGKTYRLPSEAEWEYACRAGKDTNYCGGDDVNAVAWYGSNSDSKTHPVGGKQANGWGLYDMSGNVWEWVQDTKHSDYNGAPSDGRAWEGTRADARVLRGGSWINDPQYVRAAYRYKSDATYRFYNVGFRLARTLP